MEWMKEHVVEWDEVKRRLLAGGASLARAAELMVALRAVPGAVVLWSASDGVWTTVRAGNRVGCAKRARHLKHGDEPNGARGFLIASGRLLEGRKDYGPRAVRAKVQRAVHTDAAT